MQRARSTEVHHNIVISAQESDKDQGQLNFLGGNPTLWETVSSNQSRMRQLVSASPAGVGRTLRDSSSGVAQRQQIEQEDQEKKGFIIELDPKYGGASIADLSRVKLLLDEPRAVVAARYVGVGRKHAASVLGAYQHQGEVPPAAGGRGFRHMLQQGRALI
jgi:hypothetical protein